MKRQIKFRAWTGKKLVTAFDLSQNPKYWWKDCKDYPLEQFTGLVDKNGKEIYEGDICKNGDWEEDARAYNFREEEVYWDNDNYCWQGCNGNEDGVCCEVIGNIHQDSHLL